MAPPPSTSTATAPTACVAAGKKAAGVGAASGKGSSKASGSKGSSRQKALTEALLGVQALVKAAARDQALLAQFPPAFATWAAKDRGDGAPPLAAAIAFAHAEDLSEEQRAAVWAMFEANMADVYAADDQKWSPKAKRRELFHDDARYLLVTDTSSGKLLAYSHFRFEVEENLLEDAEMESLKLQRYSPVVYCYELQLDASVHRRGLGKRLMQMLELMALKFQMHMVMLTVQKSNAGAWAFYQRLGYKQHPSCPSRNDFDDFDGADPGHRIMYKDLRR